MANDQKVDVMSELMSHALGTAISSYPKVMALGHRMLGGEFLVGQVVVEEKIDGSQFSFGTRDGELLCRSKNVQIDLADPGMFAKAVATVREIQHRLVDGWIYRAEFLSKPKHNTLKYGRVPEYYLIGFDVETAPSNFLREAAKHIVFDEIGMEAVPLFWRGLGSDLTQDLIDKCLQEESILGGALVEGVVIKNYDQFTPDGKIAMAKVVSEAFKEKHATDWKQRNPSGKDVALLLANEYATEARWRKAAQHLAESGNLEGSPRDIGPLMKEAQQDLRSEEEDAIKDVLFKHFWPQIAKGATRGLPEWYKGELAQAVFAETGEED
jgi:hypothetical protein